MTTLIIVVLLLLWLVGAFSPLQAQAGNSVHALLVIVLVLVVLRLLRLI